MNPKWEVPYDFNKIAKNYEWAEKGIRKEVIDFNFKSMTKPSEISKCLISTYDYENINNRETKYLSSDENIEFWVELGTAVHPLDYYTEIILQQMFENETSRCSIKTKSGDEISFKIKLIKIDFKGYIFELNLKDCYELAKKYKENGVLMFKNYPNFAHEYFCRAAKCLISFKPFDALDSKEIGFNPDDLDKLLQNLQLNISACLIKEKRYDDVVYLTSFVDNKADNTDKAIYRRAIALFQLKKYEEAKNVIEKQNYKDNIELVNLHTQILKNWKVDDEKYKSFVKKMFA